MTWHAGGALSRGAGGRVQQEHAVGQHAAHLPQRRQELWREQPPGGGAGQGDKGVVREERLQRVHDGPDRAQGARARYPGARDGRYPGAGRNWGGHGSGGTAAPGLATSTQRGSRLGVSGLGARSGPSGRPGRQARRWRGWWPRGGAQVQQGTGDNHAVSAMKFGILKQFVSLGWAVLLSDVDIAILQVRARWAGRLWCGHAARRHVPDARAWGRCWIHLAHLAAEPVSAPVPGLGRGGADGRV